MAMTWAELQGELRRRQDAGRPVTFWWRDDDAGAPTPALARLLELSQAQRIPLALAVIPESAEPGLFSALHADVTVLQHGTDHRNRAAQGEKKTEYPASEPVQDALARIARGTQKLRSVANFLPVLAPPWNRLRKEFLAELPKIGIRGVSTYGARKSAEPAPGVRQVNTHVDIVAWRRGRRFIGDDEAAALISKYLDHEEPVGLLTHHAVHDAAAWDFLARLFAIRGIRWLSYTAAAHG